MNGHPDLAARFVRTYDSAWVESVQLGADELVVRVCWLDAHAVLLDVDGIPESVVSEGGGAFDWRLPAPDLGPEEEALLRSMEQSRHFQTDNGFVICTGLAEDS